MTESLLGFCETSFQKDYVFEVLYSLICNNVVIQKSKNGKSKKELISEILIIVCVILREAMIFVQKYSTDEMKKSKPVLMTY